MRCWGKNLLVLNPTLRKTLSQPQSHSSHPSTIPSKRDKSPSRHSNSGGRSSPASDPYHEPQPPSRSYFDYYDERPLVVEPSRADRETRAWVDANLAAVHPDGSKALHDTYSAVASITNTLKWFHELWVWVSQQCHSPKITAADAAVIASKWEGDKEAVKNAINQIAKSSDAILVHAIGAPRPRQEPQGIGYYQTNRALLAAPGDSHQAAPSLGTTVYNIGAGVVSTAAAWLPTRGVK